MSRYGDTMTLEGAGRLIDEGTASMALAGLATRRPAPLRERYDVIVIGGGQAGLSVGYYLARAGLRFTILDANARIGDSWRKRWDSLRLFSHAKFDGLHGMPFPAPRNSFPTKDQMADYLEAYAKRFTLPVRNGVRVERLHERNGRFVAKAGELEFEAEQVVVAMADYQVPKVPEFASGLASDIVQMTSTEYRNPGQLKPGGVLLVGAGNTGADIAIEAACNGHDTWLAGPDVGAVPFRPEGSFASHVLMPALFRIVFHRLLTLATPIGRKVRAKGHRATPLIRVKPKDLEAAGVRRVPRVVGVRGGRPLLEDGWALDVANVIWSAGFHRGFEWIDLPVFGADGAPMHEGGVVESEPGLYFVGLTFLYAMSSSMIQGVGRDAARIVGKIAARIESALPDARAVPATPGGMPSQ